jgi:hypothetical protein
MVPLLVIFADGVGMLADFGINMHGVVFAFLKRFDSLAFIDISDNQNVLLWFFLLE